MVIDDVTSKGLALAHLTIEGRDEGDVSEGNGNFKIPILDTTLATVRIQATKDGYMPSDRRYDIPGNVIITLTPLKKP